MKNVYVLLGCGDGARCPDELRRGGYLPALASGDLNRAASSTRWSPTRTRSGGDAAGHGNGTFGPYVAHSLSYYAETIAIGDLNGDAT
jgi:hypothetical protein